MSKNSIPTTIGILSAGGDCPGINAAIRGVGKTAIVEYGMKVLGISSGYLGLINQEYEVLGEDKLSGLLTVGGTILGTSREKPFKKDKAGIYQIDKPKLIRKSINRTKILFAFHLANWHSSLSNPSYFRNYQPRKKIFSSNVF